MKTDGKNLLMCNARGQQFLTVPECARSMAEHETNRKAANERTSNPDRRIAEIETISEELNRIREDADRTRRETRRSGTVPSKSTSNRVAIRTDFERCPTDSTSICSRAAAIRL